MPERVLRVVITGVESSGKTTLATALARELGAEWVPEYGREYTVEKYGQGCFDWDEDDFVRIALEQEKQEREACARADKVVVGDTDAYATSVWAERYLGRKVKAVEAIGLRSLPDLYLLALPDFPFVKDAIRDGEHIRKWMHTLFVQRIAEAGVPCVELGGPHPVRLQKALEVIRARLAGS